MAIEAFLKKLELELELTDAFSPDGAGNWSILLDEIMITVQETTEGFTLFALLDEIPREQQETFMTKMLRGNLFGQATNNAYLGLDERGEKVVVQLVRQITPSYREFTEELEDFFSTCDFWQKEIKNAKGL